MLLSRCDTGDSSSCLLNLWQRSLTEAAVMALPFCIKFFFNEGSFAGKLCSAQKYMHSEHSVFQINLQIVIRDTTASVAVPTVPKQGLKRSAAF